MPGINFPDLTIIEKGILNTNNIKKRTVTALQRGWHFLFDSARGSGIQPIIGLDFCFHRTISLDKLRDCIKKTYCVDIGFDCSEEYFSSMLALKLLSNTTIGLRWIKKNKLYSLIKSQEAHGRFHFFHRRSGFAPDTDCTSMATAALFQSRAISNRDCLRYATQLLLSAAPDSVPAGQNIDPGSGLSNGDIIKGVVMVYWDENFDPNMTRRGRKHDAVVAANALYALNLAKKAGLADGKQVILKTTEYVINHLISGEYKKGTRYYPSSDVFLYFVSELCKEFPNGYGQYYHPIIMALAERNEAPPDSMSANNPQSAMNIALRVLVAENLAVPNNALKEKLLNFQTENGSWPPAALYTMGKRRIYFGSAAITTMFAIRALQSKRKKPA